MPNITEEKWIEMLEKKADGTYIAKYPKVKSKSGITFDEHLAEKASKTDFGHVKVGDRLSVVDGVVSADVQYVPVWGKATYTDSVSAGERLVKNINIGSGKKGGHIVYYTPSSNDYKGIVFFNTNYLKSFAISQDTSYGARTSIREHEPTGVSSFGNLRTKLDKIYISGNNLVLEILNDFTSAVTLNLVVYWEVW